VLKLVRGDLLKFIQIKKENVMENTKFNRLLMVLMISAAANLSADDMPPDIQEKFPVEETLSGPATNKVEKTSSIKTSYSEKPAPLNPE
jgi:hypothetical protein